MADKILIARSAFGGLMTPGRYGARREGTAAVVLSHRPAAGIAQVVARRDARSQVLWKLREASHTATAIAPEQWLVMADEKSMHELQEALEGIATVVDMSSAREVVRISGPRARDVLAKGCAIDLDPSVFRAGLSAATEIAHIGCTVWQVDAAPSFDLIVARSLAESFYEWLAASAAPFGYEVAAAA